MPDHTGLASEDAVKSSKPARATAIRLEVSMWPPRTLSTGNGVLRDKVQLLDDCSLHTAQPDIFVVVTSQHGSFSSGKLRDKNWTRLTSCRQSQTTTADNRAYSRMSSQRLPAHFWSVSDQSLRAIWRLIRECVNGVQDIGNGHNQLYTRLEIIRDVRKSGAGPNPTFSPNPDEIQLQPKFGGIFGFENVLRCLTMCLSWHFQSTT